jgi:hypothetical protein
MRTGISRRARRDRPETHQRREATFMKQLFVIAQKRSGSTLLQRILNQIPGFSISGENGGAFIALADFYDKLSSIPSHKSTIRSYEEGKSGVKPSWLNPWIDDIERILDHLRRMMQDMYAAEGTQVWGFKEIRYGRFGESYDEFVGQLTLLRVLFPRSKFVLLSRGMDALIQSNLRRPPEGRGYTEDQLTQMVKLQFSHFQRFAQEHPDNSFMLFYEDIRDQTPRLRKELFEFLQVPFNEAFMKPMARDL